MKRILFFFLLLLTAFLPALNGCGKGSSGDGGAGSGVLRIAGSTSMMPISEKLARAYEKKHPGVRIHIEGGDSTLGIKGAAHGIVDIGSVSRPLTEEEKKVLQPFKITEDSISIVVNSKNPVQELTINDAREVFSGRITNWIQVGGPDRPVTVIGRERGSGTQSVFEDTVMSGKPATDSGALVMTSTGSVISTVIHDINAIGYVSSNYRAEGVKTLEIHTGEHKAIVLSRPLYYVIRAGTSGLARDYIAFCTGEEGRELVAGQKEQ